MSARYATDTLQAVYHLRNVFELNPYLASYNWNIIGEDDAVLIQATVHHGAIARLAESVASRVCGDTCRIINRIEINPEYARLMPRPRLYKKLEDLNMLTSITIKYDLNRYTRQGRICLDVMSGSVILSGTVKDRITRYYAQELACDTFGINRLTDQLIIDPVAGNEQLPVDSPFLKTPLSNLKVVLALSKRFSALPVSVGQQGDAIFLEGEVGDELNRMRLINLASTVLGVNRIVADGLSVRPINSA